jgi:hypothetical protein
LQGLDLHCNFQFRRFPRNVETHPGHASRQTTAQKNYDALQQRKETMQKIAGSLAILFLAAGSPSAFATEPEIREKDAGAASPAATIDDVGFLSGHWIGSGLGACSEEFMAEPAGGQIMGMFRQMSAEGGLRFYEFYSIQENAGSLVLKIKHFNPDLTGWEEKNDTVDFPLVAIEGATAYFDGLTFARIGKKGFSSAVKIDRQDVAIFTMREAKRGEGCS